MTWARVSSIGIAVAVALVIIANAPAVLTDPLYMAVAQIRINAAKTPPPIISSEQYQQSFTGATGEEVEAPKKTK